MPKIGAKVKLNFTTCLVVICMASTAYASIGSYVIASRKETRTESDIKELKLQVLAQKIAIARIGIVVDPEHAADYKEWLKTAQGN